MKFIKISNNFVNMDEVVHAIDEEDELTLVFTLHDNDQPYIWRFENDDATAIRKWLIENSDEL